MRWLKADQAFVGKADFELLDRLSRMVKLPPGLEELRRRLRSAAEAVERERFAENPVPLVVYPVKTPLFRHQVRGANMAMLVFGFPDLRDHSAPGPE